MTQKRPQDKQIWPMPDYAVQELLHARQHRFITTPLNSCKWRLEARQEDMWLTATVLCCWRVILKDFGPAPDQVQLKGEWINLLASSRDHDTPADRRWWWWWWWWQKLWLNKMAFVRFLVWLSDLCRSYFRGTSGVSRSR